MSVGLIYAQPCAACADEGLSAPYPRIGNAARRAAQASHLKLESMSFYLQILFPLYARLESAASVPAKNAEPPALGSEARRAPSAPDTRITGSGTMGRVAHFCGLLVVPAYYFFRIRAFASSTFFRQQAAATSRILAVSLFCTLSHFSAGAHASHRGGRRIPARLLLAPRAARLPQAARVSRTSLVDHHKPAIRAQLLH
eukprot:5202958-Pleurochrysis_carterae.AAC.4